MKKRKLGRSEFYVTPVGLGTMSIGTDRKRAEAIIHTALEAGINYFDTADLYDFGENEKLVGSILRPYRDEVIIATKVGNRWNDQRDGWHWDASKNYIKEAAKKSLGRLGVDVIDLLQLHGGTMEDRIDETIEAFEELKEEGIIRYYGISSIRPTVIREYAERSDIVSVMTQYSILDRRPEEQSMPLLSEKGISVCARGPVAQGLVSDNYLKKWTETVKEKGYLDYTFEELQRVIESLNERFSGKRTLTEIALQFVLANPTVAVAVFGASSPEQVKENIRAASQPPLTGEELAFIKSVSKENRYEKHRLA
jgi:Aldo/keto reductase family.